MDCLDRSLSETESPPPFQHLVTEQAKSFLALQELQNEVGALLEFRDLVIESFPHLRVKMASSCLATPTPTSSLHSASKWEPGVRVRRKLGASSGASSQGGDIVPSLLPRSRSNSHGKGPKSGETSAGSSAVQDSGFCTESKEHSAASSATSGGATSGTGVAGSGRGKNKEVEDELMNLLDMIQAKGTALRLEVDYLQSQLCSGPEGVDLSAEAEPTSRPRRKCRSLELFPSMRSDSSSCAAGPKTNPCGRPRDELFGLKKERDHLARRVKDLELDSAHNLAMTNSLLAEVGALSAEKRYLEDRLANYHSSSHCFTPVKHYEVDDDGREMSSTNPYKETRGGGFLASPTSCSTPARPSDPVPRKLSHVSPASGRLGTLDGIVSSPGVHMRSPRGVKLSRYKEKMVAILRESRPLELQRHLLTTVFHNEILTYQVDNITKSRVELVCQLAKIKEENEDLKFQLEEKSIELEGTRARVRLYERLQTVKTSNGGGAGEGGVHTLVPANPILPQLTLPCGGEQQPLSSSTESAHHEDSGSSMDKLSVTRSPSKRRSKIPLKAYAAPKHPAELGNHGNGVLSNGVPSNKSSASSIPKYQKDASWHSNQSRKSAESLISTPLPMPGSRNWDSSKVSSHLVKKPAILSNKELSLATRRESLPLKAQQHTALHKSQSGEAFARRLRKTSSESSSNSSGSSPRYGRDLTVSPVMKKQARPVTAGPDTKWHRPEHRTPLPDSVETAPPPRSPPSLRPPAPLRKLNRPHRSRSLEKSSIITLPAVDEVNECGDSLDVTPPSPTKAAQEDVLNRSAQGSHPNDSQGSASTGSDEPRPEATQEVPTPGSVNTSSGTRLDSVSNLAKTNTKSTQPPVPTAAETTHRTPQEGGTLSPQTRVRHLISNSETYVVITSDVRRAIPEFSAAEAKAVGTGSKSHTYRVRKPNRFVDMGPRDSSAPSTGASRTHEPNKKDGHDRVNRSERILPCHNGHASPPGPIPPSHSGHASPPGPIPPSHSGHASAPRPNSSCQLSHRASAEDVRNSVEYFDSIETSSGSVLISMSSNRPRRESLAECDSLDQSQPDISDSDDLV